MTLVLLRRVPVANVAPATGFTVRVETYDTRYRRLYTDATQETTNTGPNAPFELTLNALVPGASFCYGSTLREVRYAGDGTVSTHDNPAAPSCASALGGLTLTSSDQGLVYELTAKVTATWSGAVGPVTVRFGLVGTGLSEVTEYTEERALPAGSTSAVFPGPPPASTTGSAVLDRVARFLNFDPNTGLAPGRYRVDVTEDATGATVGEEITIEAHLTSDPSSVRLYGTTPTGGAATTFLVLNNGPLRVVQRRSVVLQQTLEIYVERVQAGDRLLKLLVTPSFGTVALVQAWVYRAGAVLTGELLLDNNTTPASVTYGEVLGPLDYALPAGTVVGGFPTAPIRSNGQGGVHLAGYDPHQRLALANLILFNPTTGDGGVIVEARTGFDTHLDQAGTPLLYELSDDTGTVLSSNTVGAFDGLAAIQHYVTVTDPERPSALPLVVSVPLSNDYGLWRQMSFPDHHGHPCRLELHRYRYTGSVGTLCGQSEDGEGPLTLLTEALQGGDTQGDFPPSAGSSLVMRLRASRGELQDALLDDRACRADFYYRDELQFTGYVQPDIYAESLVSRRVDVELTATCGLAGLKDVNFAGHKGQELRGRYSRLSTLLHCLSRTGLSLPLTIAANLRAAEMLTDETPEEAIFIDRLAYAEMDQRAVVDALSQSLGGTLVQRNGQWMVLSALEAAKTAPARHYRPAGTDKQPLSIGAPTVRLTPERVAKSARLAGVLRGLYWLNQSQGMQRRAGWKYYTGTADATYAENAFRQGDYFSDASFWDASGTVLRPETGWQPGPLGFPLSLVDAGAQGDEVAAVWPLSGPYDNRYLESELAPIEAGREGEAFTLSVEAKFLGRSYQTASLWVEIVASRGGQPVSLGAVLEFKAVSTLRDGFTTGKFLVPFGLLAGAQAPLVRLHVYTCFPDTYKAPATATRLLVKSVALQVLPQGAKWDGSTAFIASGAGGSVRPTAPLEVFHVDAPDKAGYFLGTALAFRRTLTRLPLIPTTVWARADDVQGAPMLASQVLDVLALRGNPSRLLTGTVRHLGYPPELLDSVDAPYDIPGRRFAVGARAWHVRPAETDLTVVEIGAGEFLTPPAPFLPQGVQVLRGLSSGARRVLLSRRPHTARAVRL